MVWSAQKSVFFQFRALLFESEIHFMEFVVKKTCSGKFYANVNSRTSKTTVESERILSLSTVVEIPFFSLKSDANFKFLFYTAIFFIIFLIFFWKLTSDPAFVHMTIYFVQILTMAHFWGSIMAPETALCIMYVVFAFHCEPKLILKFTPHRYVLA